MTIRDEFPVLFGRDAWFDKYHADNVTNAFARWWIEYYDVPADYVDIGGERHEYFVHCAFALVGWLAAGGK